MGYIDIVLFSTEPDRPPIRAKGEANDRYRDWLECRQLGDADWEIQLHG